MGEEQLLHLIREIHEDIRAAVTSPCESAPREAVSAVVESDEGVSIYAIDRISETMLVDLFERKIASQVPIPSDCRRTARRKDCSAPRQRRCPPAALLNLTRSIANRNKGNLSSNCRQLLGD